MARKSPSMPEHNGNPEDQAGGLALPKPPDSTDNQLHTNSLSTDDGVDGAMMVLRIRKILKDFYPFIARLAAIEAFLIITLARIATAEKELIVDVEHARRDHEETRQSLGLDPRPQTGRRRKIGKRTSFLIVLAEAGLAFAGAEAVLPNLSVGGGLGLALSLAPYGFVIGVCGAAYAAMESSGVAFAEALQRDPASSPESQTSPTPTDSKEQSSSASPQSFEQIMKDAVRPAGPQPMPGEAPYDNHNNTK